MKNNYLPTILSPQIAHTGQSFATRPKVRKMILKLKIYLFIPWADVAALGVGRTYWPSLSVLPLIPVA